MKKQTDHQFIAQIFSPIFPTLEYGIFIDTRVLYNTVNKLE